MKVEIKVNEKIKSNVENIWNLVGSFAKIADWFEGISNTEIAKSKNGNTIRHLTLANGAILSDELIESGNFYYKYKIIEGDVPFENYVATIGVNIVNDIANLYYKASIDVSIENRDSSVTFLEDLYSGAFKNVKLIVEKQ